MLSIYGYRRYPVIPNPLETFIIKNRQPIGIVIKRNCGKKVSILSFLSGAPAAQIKRKRIALFSKHKIDRFYFLNGI